MKQKLILQVGTGKTGTTFIQQALASNSDALLDQGICYPRAGRKGAQAGHHSFYAALAGGKEWWLTETARPDDILRDMIAEIRASGCAHAVISEESLVWLPADIVHFLAVTLEEFDVRIVVDLRRQDLYVDSALNQLVKAAGRTFTHDQLWQFDGTWYVPDYYSVILKWARSFGPWNIVVRPFERSQMLGADILDDFFLRALGASVTVPRSESDSAQNDRLSRASLEFKRIMNFLFAERPQTCAQLMAPLLQRDVETGAPGGAILSDATRRKILEDTKAHNDAIVAEFNHSTDDRTRLKPGIFVEPFRPSETEPFGELAKVEIASMLAAVRKENPDLVRAIRNAPVPEDTPQAEFRQIQRIRELIDE